MTLTHSQRSIFRSHKKKWNYFFSALTPESWNAVRETKEYKEKMETQSKKERKRQNYFRKSSFLEKPTRKRRPALKKLERSLHKLNSPFMIMDYGANLDYYGLDEHLNWASVRFNQYEDIYFFNKDKTFYWNALVTTCNDEVREEFSNAIFDCFNQKIGREIYPAFSISKESENKIKAYSIVLLEKGYQTGVGVYIRVPDTKLTFENISFAIQFVQENEDLLLKEGRLEFPQEMEVSQDVSEIEALRELLPMTVALAYQAKYNSDKEEASEQAIKKGLLTQDEWEDYCVKRHEIVRTPEEKKAQEALNNRVWSLIQEEVEIVREKRQNYFDSVVKSFHLEEILKNTKPLDQYQRAKTLFDYVFENLKKV